MITQTWTSPHQLFNMNFCIQSIVAMCNCTDTALQLLKFKIPMQGTMLLGLTFTAYLRNLDVYNFLFTTKMIQHTSNTPDTILCLSFKEFLSKVFYLFFAATVIISCPHQPVSLPSFLLHSFYTLVYDNTQACDTLQPHKVKTHFVHFRLHANYFPLHWKIPKEISRRSMLFNN